MRKKRGGYLFFFARAEKDKQSHKQGYQAKIAAICRWNQGVKFRGGGRTLEGSRKDVLPRMSDIDRMVVWNFHEGMKLFVFEWVEWTGGENSHAW
jgi:hypothetical protein